MAVGEKQGREAWRETWTRAQEARDRGQIAKAVALYGQTTKLRPSDANVWLDAADFVGGLNRSLDRCLPIYARHAAAFNLGLGTFPVMVSGSHIGSEGWDYTENCLREVLARAPERAKARELLTDSLEHRGLLDRAIDFRREFEKSGGALLHDNGLAIARLLDRVNEPDSASAFVEAVHHAYPSSPEALVALADSSVRAGKHALVRSAVSQIDGLLADSISKMSGTRTLLAFVLATARLRPGDTPPGLVACLSRQCATALVYGDDLDACLADLAEGLLALVAGDRNRATRLLAAATHGFDSEQPRQTSPSKPTTTALAWARAILSDRRVGLPLDGVPPHHTAQAVERAQAQALLASQRIADGLSLYAHSLRRFHVTALPQTYEIHGDYKLFVSDGRYHAVPRRERDFVVRYDTAYRITGVSRSSTRLLPPWLMDLLHPFAGRLREIYAGSQVVFWRMIAVSRWLVGGTSRRGRRMAGPILRSAINAARPLFAPVIGLVRAVDRRLPFLRQTLLPVMRGARFAAQLVAHRARGFLSASQRLLQGTSRALMAAVRRLAFKAVWRRYRIADAFAAPAREQVLAMIADRTGPQMTVLGRPSALPAE